MFKDRVARHGVMIGGFGVIVAILLIFFYLLYVVFPLLKPASAEHVAELPARRGCRRDAVSGDGGAGRGCGALRPNRTGALLRHPGWQDPDRAGSTGPGKASIVSSLAEGGKGRSVVGLGLSDGSVLITQHTYQVSFPG